MRWLVMLLMITQIVACDKQPIQLTGKTMGASYHITLVDLPEIKSVENIQQDIAGLLADANNRLTTYEPTSELSRFNASPVGEWQTVSPILYNALNLSLDVARVSNGAFDPTVLPLVVLWGFGPGKHLDRVPAQAEILRLKNLIGYRYLELDNQQGLLRARKTQAIEIDLSGMGHGYGSDLVADYLDRLGVANYIAEVAGEMRIKGHRANGDPWRVAIEKPHLDNSDEIYQAINLSKNIGIATSGDYRNFFMQNGVRYSHTINPETGWPINHKLSSVTVLDRSAARADALATAILVMGPEKGRAFAEKMKLQVYFILHD